MLSLGWVYTPQVNPILSAYSFTCPAFSLFSVVSFLFCFLFIDNIKLMFIYFCRKNINKKAFFLCTRLQKLVLKTNYEMAGGGGGV